MHELNEQHYLINKTYDEIVKGGAILKPLGGQPAVIGREGKNSIWGAVVLATDNATYGLKLDPIYRQNLQTGFTQGRDNLLWKGGVANVEYSLEDAQKVIAGK